MGNWFENIRKWKQTVFNANEFDIKNFDNFVECLSNMPEPIDRIQRSWYQYRIKHDFLTFRQGWHISVFFYVTCFCLYIASRIKPKPSKRQHCQCVYYKVSDNLGILPPSYQTSNHVISVPMGTGVSWDREANQLWVQAIKRSKFNARFMFEITFSLANYSWIAQTYSPAEILTTYESAPAASLLTEYCHMKNIKHVDFMHGEKFLTPANVFAAFDVIYIWDDYYRELFQKLRFEADEYILYTPWTGRHLPDPADEVDFCFYLSLSSAEIFRRCATVIDALIRMGYRVKVRLHPSDAQGDLAKRWLNSANIELPGGTDIFQSLSNTRAVVSICSTVLFQGYCMGKTVVIDDVTDPDTFREVKKMEYIMFTKPHSLLSTVLKDCEC